MPRPKTEYKAFQLRVPPGLYQQLKANADAAGRSMNEEIVLQLQRTYDRRVMDYIINIELLDEEEHRAQEYLDLRCA
jgi:hypothetical protein